MPEIKIWSPAQDYFVPQVYSSQLLLEHSQQVTNPSSYSQDPFMPMGRFLVIFVFTTAQKRAQTSKYALDS
jgi:hypothetical protein